MPIKIGLIGGSGLEKADFFVSPQERQVATAWSDQPVMIIEGNVQAVEVAYLSRHGREHTLTPSQVNYRANLAALQQLGCTHILATTAVGSLREEIGRGDLVIIDQFIDFAKQRKATFFESFEPGNAKHTPMADPFDQNLRNILITACEHLQFAHHKKGTVVTIEGPRFSTRAESHMFRLWGADIINMSIATEAALANELGIPYAAVAMSTDYDCWKEDEEPVSWEQIYTVFKENAVKVTSLLVEAIPRVANLK